MMKKGIFADQFLEKHFGIDVNGLSNVSIDQEVQAKQLKYLEKDEVGRAMLYGTEATQNAYLKRALASLSLDAEQLAGMIISLEDIPNCVTRKVKDYFQPLFPGFDKGASISFGKHFKKCFDYLIQQEGAITKEGEAMHLSNMVMKNLQESRSSFYKKLRRNVDLRNSFKAKLDDYCAMWWYVAMNYEGTLDNSVINGVKRDEKTNDDRKAS